MNNGVLAVKFVEIKIRLFLVKGRPDQELMERHMSTWHRVTGYALLGVDRQMELDDLTEAATHQDSMRFTALDALTLSEYEALMTRLEAEQRADLRWDLSA